MDYRQPAGAGRPRPVAPTAAAATAPTAPGAGAGAAAARRVARGRAEGHAEQDPKDAETRVAAREPVLRRGALSPTRSSGTTRALKIDPKNVNASTDLGIAYYYTNKPDLALAQFEKSLAIDPRHSKTLLNVGIVRAFGKEDLDGAAEAWQKVIEMAPDSPEAAVAKKGLDGMRSGHAATPGAPAAKSPGNSE